MSQSKRQLVKGYFVTFCIMTRLALEVRWPQVAVTEIITSVEADLRLICIYFSELDKVIWFVWVWQDRLDGCSRWKRICPYGWCYGSCLQKVSCKEPTVGCPELRMQPTCCHDHHFQAQVTMKHIQHRKSDALECDWCLLRPVQRLPGVYQVYLSELVGVCPG